MSAAQAFKIAKLTHDHDRRECPAHREIVADVLSIVGLSRDATLPGVAELADMLTTINPSVGKALSEPYTWG